MYARTALAVLLAGALCASVGASRKFTGTQYLEYDADGSVIVDDLTEFGLSVWILKRAHDDENDPDIQGIIDNRETANADGFILYYEYDDSDPTAVKHYVVFEYKGDLDLGGSGTLEVKARIKDNAKWRHVAVNLLLSGAGMTSTAHIYIDGVHKDSDTDLEFEPMAGSESIFIANGPGLFLPGSDRNFRGDVHDVCIVNDCWDSTELADLQDESARDATSDLQDVIFNPRLRDWKCKDDITDIEPTIVNSPKKGMGPAITYGDQMPTVLVIGDTQCLCSNSDMEGSMAKLGAFIENYKDTLETAAVFHVGDWVNSVNANEHEELGDALELVTSLDNAGVPWACTIGNHEYDRMPGLSEATREIAEWTDVIPDSFFKYEDWHVGQMGTDEHLDGDYAHAFTFDLDGVTQLGICLPYSLTEAQTFPEDPLDYTLGWALDVAEDYWDDPSYPGLRVWLVTHEFLDGSTQGFYPQSYDYEFDEDDEPTYGHEIGPAAAIQDLDDIDDLAFIFCGHHPWRPVLCLAGETATLPFYTIRIDHQGSPYENDGAMLILAVEVDQGELKKFYAETYAPLMDEFLGDGTDYQTFEGDLTD